MERTAGISDEASWICAVGDNTSVNPRLSTAASRRAPAMPLIGRLVFHVLKERNDGVCGLADDRHCSDVQPGIAPLACENCPGHGTHQSLQHASGRKPRRRHCAVVGGRQGWSSLRGRRERSSGMHSAHVGGGSGQGAGPRRSRSGRTPGFGQHHAALRLERLTRNVSAHSLTSVFPRRVVGRRLRTG